MHRPLYRAVAILTLAVLLVSHTPAGAQEATPVPTVVGEITIAETRFGLADIVPTAPVSIVHYRIEMPPGTQLVVAPNPSLEMYRIASGMVTITLEDDSTLTREGVPDRVLPGGEAAPLGPGDGFMWMPQSAGQVRNDGTEPVVLLVVVMIPEIGLPAAEVGFATPTP